MIKTIEAGQYIFRVDPEDSIQVEYPDGKIIDLKNINIINIGIMPQDGEYNVTLITRESIQKVQNNITKNLEIVGFHFEDLAEAITIQNTIIIHLFRSEHVSGD